MKARLDAKTARVNITDSRGRGLVLRGGPEGLVWGHRVQVGGKPCRMVLGTVDRWTIAEARSIADAATDYAKSHKRAPDDAWLQAHLVETGKIAAPTPSEIGSDFPTFAQAREEYLQVVATYLSAAAVASYRGSLEHAKVKAALDERRLPTITRDDVMEIVLDVHQKHERTAELIVSAIRPMFNHLGEDGRRRRYGVEPGIMVPLKAPRRKVARITSIEDDDDEQPWSDGYVPEISELGRIIAVARSGIIRPIPAGAVELVCWTVQRRRAIATARLQDFFALGDGTGLWRIPAISRKGKSRRPHTIPLPAQVWACVEKAAAVAKEKDPKTKYLFPGARPRRIGMPVTHLNPSTLGHRFTDIPDCGATLHDVRRTMGTHGEKLIGFSRLDTGFIMDHEESVKQSDRITSRTAGNGTHDVTGVHYSLHDGTHHSWPVMRAWADAVEKAVVEAAAALDMARLARGYGDPGYRIGGPPAPMLLPMGPLEGEELEEVRKREAVIRSQVRSLGVADEDG